MKKILLIFLVLQSCLSKRPETIPCQCAVVIVKDFSEVGRIFNYNDGSVLRILDPDFQITNGSKVTEFAPARFDTIVVNDIEETAQLAYRISQTEVEKIHISPGDSILIDYSHSWPYATLLNGNTKYGDTNYIPKLLGGEVSLDFPASGINGHWQLAPAVPNHPYLVALRNNAFDLRMSQFLHENGFLDSLMEVNGISQRNYRFRKDRIRFDSLRILLRHNKIDRDHSFKLIHAHNQEGARVKYSLYPKFLWEYVQKYVINKSPIILTGNGSHLDYRVAYDSLKFASYLGKHRDEILARILGEIGNHFTYDDFKTYFEQFRNDTFDEILVHELSKQYLVDLDSLMTESEQLYVADLKKKQFTLSQILKRYTGNVIYVDFWASWCAPCIEQMPASHQLYEEYYDRGIRIIYLSSDNNLSAWQKASRDHGLELYETNLVLINTQHSTFLRDLNFESIPRYLIFDKSGKLVHQNAPGPGTTEIRELLDKYIKGSQSSD